MGRFRPGNTHNQEISPNGTNRKIFIFFNAFFEVTTDFEPESKQHQKGPGQKKISQCVQVKKVIGAVPNVRARYPANIIGYKKEFQPICSKLLVKAPKSRGN